MKLGHNTAATAPTEAYSMGDGDDDRVVFHYAQWHVGDYIAGTRGMSLEAEGAYQRFLMRLYERGKPLPDDDKFMCAVMSLSLRVWKRLKDTLVTLGKIIARAGCLTNGRFEKERQKRAEEMRKRSAAAQARWGKTSAKFDESLDETSGKFPAKAGKKPNKINEPTDKVDMLTNNQNPITIEEQQQDDAVEVQGLNGATYLIQMRVAKWMNPLQPDYRTAQEWIANMVRICGPEIFKEAFAHVETKVANGDPLGNIIKYFSGIVTGKMREQREKADQKKAAIAQEKARKNVKIDLWA